MARGMIHFLRHIDTDQKLKRLEKLETFVAQLRGAFSVLKDANIDKITISSIEELLKEIENSHEKV